MLSRRATTERKLFSKRGKLELKTDDSQDKAGLWFNNSKSISHTKNATKKDDDIFLPTTTTTKKKQITNPSIVNSISKSQSIEILSILSKNYRDKFKGLGNVES